MMNLVPSLPPGIGFGAGTRGSGNRWLLLGLFSALLVGCATKGDLRDLQDEIRDSAARQEAILEEISGLNLAVQDTLGRQSDAIFESRGDINRRLQMLEQEVLTIQELLRMNQQSLMTIRDLLESRRSLGEFNRPTDTEPGQVTDMGLASVGERAGGCGETFGTAHTQYQRGSLTTARRAFQDFLRVCPDDALAPDAHYYLADILVQEEQLDEAIQAFLEIPQLFPTADRVPEVWYRVGVTYIELERLDDARIYLRRVVNSYPDSDAAEAAQERLDEIG